MAVDVFSPVSFGDISARNRIVMRPMGRTNLREDDHSVSPENRIRFPVRVAEAVAAEAGPRRVGVRLSPGISANLLTEVDAVRTSAPRSCAIPPSVRRLTYVRTLPRSSTDVNARMWARWTGGGIHNVGTDVEWSAADLLAGIEDQHSAGPSAVSPGSSSPTRTCRNACSFECAWRLGDPKHFYGGNRKGPTDYEP
jgi:N-ethylmaleimide reductase